ITPTALAGVDERPGHAGQAHSRECGSRDVDAADGHGITCFGDVGGRGGGGHDGQWYVDQEDQTPGSGTNEPPTDEWPDRGGDPGQPRPGTHGSPTGAGGDALLNVS